MRVWHSIVLAHVIIVTGCHTANVSQGNSARMTIEERIARGIDWDNRPLPKDRKNLAISWPSSSIRFTVPEGWHIQNQPGLNALRYTLTYDGTFGNLPFLTVEIITEERGRISESRSHQERLGDIRTNFPSAKMQPIGTTKLSDGRSIQIVEYVGRDVPEIASFVPEKGYVTAFILTADNKETLKDSRSTFESILRSYRP